VSLETQQAICYILCHLVPLDPHVLRSKTQGKKGLISYQIENGTSTMKKHYKVEHSNIFKRYAIKIV
jgi:hypothetical protein